MIALEEKISYLEDLAESLNTLAARQQQQIEWLARELLQLRRQGTDPGGSAGGSLRDELPPHY